MKKIIRVFMLFLALSAFAASKNYAQEVVVRTRMYHARDVRPMRPSRRHVWVAAEWTPGEGNYAYHAGYWALPPRPGVIWVSGHWVRRPRGWVWVPGHWNA
jgi:hypothetical protein